MDSRRVHPTIWWLDVKSDRTLTHQFSMVLALGSSIMNLLTKILGNRRHKKSAKSLRHAWRFVHEHLEARTLLAAIPTATLVTTPQSPLIGETATFELGFQNTSPTDTGYGLILSLTTQNNLGSTTRCLWKEDLQCLILCLCRTRSSDTEASHGTLYHGPTAAPDLSPEPGRASRSGFLFGRDSSPEDLALILTE